MRRKGELRFNSFAPRPRSAEVSPALWRHEFAQAHKGTRSSARTRFHAALK